MNMGASPHTPLLIFENGIMWKAGSYGGPKMLDDELIFSDACGSDRLLCPINRAGADRPLCVSMYELANRLSAARTVMKGFAVPPFGYRFAAAPER